MISSVNTSPVKLIKLLQAFVLYNNGTHNASIRVLISMMILKEAEGMSNQKPFENYRFNMLISSTLGPLNTEDPVPTESTYYLLRKRIVGYEKENKENLFDIVFSQLTKKQCLDFDVNGKRNHMDSKLLGSNIAWLSRYELVHETLRLFCSKTAFAALVDALTLSELELVKSLLSETGNKGGLPMLGRRSQNQTDRPG